MPTQMGSAGLALRPFRGRSWAIMQTSVAAEVAWFITHDVLGHRQPFFALTAIPHDVLSAVLGVPASTFEQIPTVPGRIVIVKRPEGQTGARPTGS